MRTKARPLQPERKGRLEELKEELFQIIQTTMETEGISQGEVARRMGAQRYNINKVMRRKFAVTLDFLVRIAESLGIMIDLKITEPRGVLHRAATQKEVGSGGKQKPRSNLRNRGA